MIRISITQAAFDAIAATSQSATPEADRTEKGEVHIWLEERWANKLAAMRGPGESYSDVIFAGGGSGGCDSASSGTAAHASNAGSSERGERSCGTASHAAAGRDLWVVQRFRPSPVRDRISGQPR
jgi:hypothetical protein